MKNEILKINKYLNQFTEKVIASDRLRLKYNLHEWTIYAA